MCNLLSRDSCSTHRDNFYERSSFTIPCSTFILHNFALVYVTSSSSIAMRIRQQHDKLHIMCLVLQSKERAAIRSEIPHSFPWQRNVPSLFTQIPHTTTLEMKQKLPAMCEILSRFFLPLMVVMLSTAIPIPRHFPTPPDHSFFTTHSFQ